MLLDSKAIWNHILPKAIKRLGMAYRQKDLYPLVIISKDPIIYKDKVIYFEIRLVKLKVEGRHIII